MVFFMNKTLKIIIIRILILIVPILLLNVWHLLTFDPHARCTGDEHRHVDGYLGIAMLSIFWLFVWLVLIALEIGNFFLGRYLNRNS